MGSIHRGSDVCVLCPGIVCGKEKKMTAQERKAEIKRVNAVIRSSASPKLRRDMAKYLKRLEKEERFGTVTCR
jgi:hypothetical protein